MVVNSPTTPLVSVVVPVFNVERYLRQCVESILEQSYSHLEVLLIDDGSTDESSVLCDALASEDARIRVLHYSNGGLSLARNRGLDLMTGDFVTFVDSDDWLHCDMIETLLNLAVDWQADVACAGFERTTGGFELGGVDQSGVDQSQAVILDAAETICALLGARHVQLTVAWAKLYRSELWGDLRFPVGRLHEDEFTTHRALHASRRTVVIDRPLYFYRQHGQSIMGSRHSVARGVDITDAFRERAEFLTIVGPPELGSAAHIAAFKKLVQFHAWLRTTEPELRDKLVEDMRSSLRAVEGSPRPIGFRIFSRVYAASPALGAALYRGQARVRGTSLPK